MTFWRWIVADCCCLARLLMLRFLKSFLLQSCVLSFLVRKVCNRVLGSMRGRQRGIRCIYRCCYLPIWMRGPENTEYYSKLSRQIPDEIKQAKIKIKDGFSLDDVNQWFLFRKEQNLVRSVSACYCKLKLAHSKKIHTQKRLLVFKHYLQRTHTIGYTS